MNRDHINSALRAEFQKKNIEGRIQGLVGRLYQLSPNPNTGQTGAEFISLNAAFQPAAAYEGMLGSALLEGALSQAFEATANDNSAMAALHFMSSSAGEALLDAVSDYAEYVEESKRGKGTHARYVENKTDNISNNDEEKNVEYLNDYRERLQIEETIADLSRELSALPVAAPSYAPSFG